MNFLFDNSKAKNSYSLNNDGFLFSREKIRILKKRKRKVASKKTNDAPKDLEIKNTRKLVENNAPDLYDDKESILENIKKRNTAIRKCDNSELKQFYDATFVDILSVN